MTKHLDYRQLEWGGYIVKGPRTMQRAIQDHFGDNPPADIEWPKYYPVIAWFDWHELKFVEVSRHKTLFHQQLAKLNVKFFQYNFRLPEKEVVKPTAMPDVLQTFVGLAHMRRRVGWELRKMYDKWWMAERHQKKSRFFISIHASAVEWDFYPPGIKEDGTIQCWFTNACPDSTSDGLMDPLRGIVHYLHYEGYRPLIPWDAIECVGAVRPDGSVSRLYVQQQIETPALLPTIQSLCELLQHVDIEFEDSPKEDQ